MNHWIFLNSLQVSLPSTEIIIRECFLFWGGESSGESGASDEPREPDEDEDEEEEDDEEEGTTALIK